MSESEYTAHQRSRSIKVIKICKAETLDQLSNLPPPRNDQLSYLPPAKTNKLFKKTSANGSRWMFCL